MRIPRLTRKFWIIMIIQNILNKYGLYNAGLALILLAAAGVDAFIAWREYLFVHTSIEDIWNILFYFFGMVGYFMVCAVLGDFVYDRPIDKPAFGVLDGFVISSIHFLFSIAYLFYWIRMPSDEWNPCQYYMPDFFWMSYHMAPLLFWAQTGLTGLCVFVFYQDRKKYSGYNKYGV